METRRINIRDIQLNKGQIEGLPTNPRQWTKTEMENLKKSIEETPELFEARGIIVYPYNGKYIVMGGNMRLSAARALNHKDVPCIVLPEDTPADKLKEIVVKDNGSFGSWDYDLLANDWGDLPLTDWGVPAWDADDSEKFEPLTFSDNPQEEIERKKKEFEEKMANGEISEEDEEYQEFLEKFKLKKTTDDCYTPTLVYDALADWVSETYNIGKEKFVRPFYPNGDYQKENYENDAVVVDNPPFSIMAEILKFYNERKIKFFLFAPHLTLFSSSSARCTALPVGVSVTYENGANVNTSFLTNLEDKSIRFKSEPTLYDVIKKANDENLKSMRKELPKYSYDHHIITTPFISQLSRLGIDFEVSVAESEPISQLDSQKASGKTIFGKGYIVSERVYQLREKAEREKAEREKAEREKAERDGKAERWELSERERLIVAKLSI